MEFWRSELAEAIPFSRAHMADVIGVSTKTISNWIDRNQLWPAGRRTAYRGYYRLAEVFDVAGFAAMRTANIPERQAAQYVRNFGFYRGFLHGDQMVDLSHRDGKWDIGVSDPSAVVSVRVNMRSVGSELFRRLSEALSSAQNNWPTGSFESFQKLYREALRLDRLPIGAAPLFESEDEN